MKLDSGAVENAVEIILKTGDIAGYEQADTEESVPRIILDRQLEAIQGTLDQVITRVKTRIAAIANQRNSGQAAHRLPHEIIVSILSEVLATDKVVDLAHPERFAHISSYWRAVMENAPSLWTFLVSSHPPAYIVKALLKSEKMPLCIFSDCEKSRDRQISRFLQLVVPHVARWHAATLLLSSDECLRYITLGPAPLLEYFTIYISGEHWNRWDGEPHDLFGGDTGRLRVLEVLGFPIRFDNASFSTLEQLCLSSMGEAAPTIRELYGTLLNCPLLTSLSLYNVEFPEEEHIEAVPIRLDQLDMLRLHNLAPRHIVQILSMIEPSPEERFVYIDFDLESRPPQIILNDLIANLFFPLLLSASTLDVSMISGVAPGFTIKSPLSHLVIRQVNRTHALTWFAQAAQRFSSCPPIRLLLQGDPNHPIGQDDLQWLQILRDLPHVELTVFSLRTEAEIVLLARNFFPQRSSQGHKELRLNGTEDTVSDVPEFIHVTDQGSLKMDIVTGEVAENWGWSLRYYLDIKSNWLVVTQIASSL